MVLILGASSLDRAIKSLPYGVYKKISVGTFNCHGLSLDERPKTDTKYYKTYMAVGAYDPRRTLLFV